jgi:hypothetical protein
MCVDNNRISKRELTLGQKEKKGLENLEELMRRRDCVNHDITILAERNWRNSTLNMEERRKLLKKARARAGLMSQ